MSMRNLFLAISLFALIAACAGDDLGDSERVITADKKEYKVGDECRFTVTITPVEGEREIRLYKNFKNLEVSFSLVDTTKNMLNDDWSKHSGQFIGESEIVVHNISREKPFTKTFVGRIEEHDNKIGLSIPELKMHVEFDKKKITDGASIRIHCFHNPINAGFLSGVEDYFEVSDFRIVPTRSSGY
jgi:hypothetical protein